MTRNDRALRAKHFVVSARYYLACARTALRRGPDFSVAIARHYIRVARSLYADGLRVSPSLITTHVPLLNGHTPPPDHLEPYLRASAVS